MIPDNTGLHNKPVAQPGVNLLGWEYTLRRIGNVTVIHDRQDLPEFVSWLGRQPMVAVDTETTGLDSNAREFRLRTIQFGNPEEAYVLPIEEMQGGVTPKVAQALQRPVPLIMFHAGFDVPIISKALEMDETSLWRRTTDVRILAHLRDPRGREEGGTGHSLEELTEHYLPGSKKLTQTLKDEFLRLKAVGVIPKAAPMSRMYELMPLDNEVYLWYAGNDPIITARLYRKLATASFMRHHRDLLRDEYELAMVTSMMDARGFLLDIEYTERLRDRLLAEEERCTTQAAGLGLENFNSPQQVAAALAKRGIKSDRKTKNGADQVDKRFLAQYAEDELVKLIIEGKKAGKWRKTWVEKFLDSCDPAGRVHPSTNTLRARTARFSITGIPAQTLPSNDSMVRSCFVSDIGEVIVPCDYQNQEMRFMAAKAPDAAMIRAFRNGDNLHMITAKTAWPDKIIVKGDEWYDKAKGGNFATGYGGGVKALMDQFGMDYPTAKRVQDAIRQAYPGLKIMSDRLQAEARETGCVTTWTGRRLPVDADRLYAALSYYVQSGCRDITAQAMLRLHRAGYTPHMRLAIHDEVVFSLPPEEAPEVARIMSTKVGMVDMPAESKIGSRSWGSLYTKDNA